MAKTTDDDFVSMAEAAKILGIAKNTIYHEYHAMRVPAIRVGRKILVSRTGLQRMIALRADLAKAASDTAFDYMKARATANVEAQKRRLSAPGKRRQIPSIQWGTFRMPADLDAKIVELAQSLGCSKVRVVLDFLHEKFMGTETPDGVFRLVSDRKRIHE